MDENTSRNTHSGFIEWQGRSVAQMLPPPAPEKFDTTQIFLLSEREMRYWTHELGVNVFMLRDAIKAAGTRCAQTVRDYLHRLHG
jgi:hypothetical protein